MSEQQLFDAILANDGYDLAKGVHVEINEGDCHIITHNHHREAIRCLADVFAYLVENKLIH